METRREYATDTPRPGHYEIDPAGSTITFRTRHVFGLLPVRGSFAISAGTIDVVEPPAASRARVEIDAASFTSPSAARDKVVRSARFLDADRHPTISFAADRLDRDMPTGTLTVRGVARAVPVSIVAIDVLPRAFSVRATARVDRTAFGVTASRGMAGRHLDLVVEITCAQIR
ncbi:YceI family protein [Embleya sp. NPDC005971]|uniref:YceI family protein n=1 Tax=unclassified Embleya TaxID=2699296 RepID=UPI0033E8F650